MENAQTNHIYVKSDEKELIKMWEDIKGSDTESLNRNLMKAIAENVSIGDQVNEENAYSRRMWDSEIGGWVPFDLWGASYIINKRKEYLALQIFRPASIQPEQDPTLWGWHSLDSSYLNEELKEKNNFEKFNQMKNIEGRNNFCELVKQDQDEYKAEGRYDELSGCHGNRRI